MAFGIPEDVSSRGNFAPNAGAGSFYNIKLWSNLGHINELVLSAAKSCQNVPINNFKNLNYYQTTY